MRATDRPQQGDEHIQTRACGDAIAQQRHRRIATREAVTHDARAGDDGQQQRGADELSPKRCCHEV